MSRCHRAAQQIPGSRFLVIGIVLAGVLMACRSATPPAGRDHETAIATPQAQQALTYLAMLDEGWYQQLAQIDARAHGTVATNHGEKGMMRADLERAGVLQHDRYVSSQPLHPNEVKPLVVRLHEHFAPTSFIVYQRPLPMEIDVIGSIDSVRHTRGPVFIAISARPLECALLRRMIAADGRFVTAPVADHDVIWP